MDKNTLWLWALFGVVASMALGTGEPVPYNMDRNIKRHNMEINAKRHNID